MVVYCNETTYENMNDTVVGCLASRLGYPVNCNINVTCEICGDKFIEVIEIDKSTIEATAKEIEEIKKIALDEELCASEITGVDIDCSEYHDCLHCLESNINFIIN